MIESASGVILRVHRLTESSLIVRWLTREQGRLSTVARGARRPKSAFAGKLDLFVAAELAFSRSRRSELHALREVTVTDFHLPLRGDVRRIRLAAYCTALLEQTTEPDTPLPGMYDLYAGLLGCLTSGEPRPRLVYAFELKLLECLGLPPSLETSRLKRATRDLARSLTGTKWDKLMELKAERAAVRELDAFLRGFLVYHLDRVPSSRSEALGTGSGPG